jgi:hypothetical protein
MVMYKIKLKGGNGINLATIKSLKWVYKNSRKEKAQAKEK